MTYHVTEQDAGKRVESILLGPLQVSHGICVNGKRVYSTYVLQAGDVVTADVEDREPPRHLEPVKMDLSIIYEDEELLVLDKPANMPVHPTKDPCERNLEQGLMSYLSANVYPHFVSRLDKGTTGLMLVAKSGYIHERMKRYLHTDNFYREYLAVSDGQVDPASGTVDAPIGLADGSSYRHCVRSDGAKSITVYETLSFVHDRTLLRLMPQTGRTHQLRVHLAYIGYPLTGDWLYGERSTQIDRPALHSHRLSFLHPLTQNRIECCSPLPDDMKNLLL